MPTSASPCQCCQCDPLVLQCRSRGATLQLCGFGEFTDVSTPPRIYKRYATTGTMKIKRYPTNTCGSPCLQAPADLSFTGNNGVDGWVWSITYTGWNSATGKHIYTVSCITGNVGDVVHSSNLLIDFLSAGHTVFHGGTIEIPTCTDFSAVALFWSNNAPIFSSTKTGGFTPEADPPHQTIDTWNFFQQSAPPDCTLTSGDTGTRTIDGVSSTFPTGAPDTVYGANVTVSTSATQISYIGTGVCVADPDNPGAYMKLVGTVTTDLTLEHTEDAAIAAFQAATPWGAWISAGDTVACPGYACCLARWELRTGTTFAYQESQYKASQGGFTPSTTFPVRVGIFRRPFGSGTLTKYQTLTFSVVSDGSGTVDLTQQDTPNERGFDTLARAACAVNP